MAAATHDGFAAAARHCVAVLLMAAAALMSDPPSAVAAVPANNTTADFDADGFMDLAVGMPQKTVNGNSGAGTVYVIYGSAGIGLDPFPAGPHLGSQPWYQKRCVVFAPVGCQTELAGDAPEQDDQFGAAFGRRRLQQ